MVIYIPLRTHWHWMNKWSLTDTTDKAKTQDKTGWPLGGAAALNETGSSAENGGL